MMDYEILRCFTILDFVEASSCRECCHVRRCSPNNTGAIGQDACGALVSASRYNRHTTSREN